MNIKTDLGCNLISEKNCLEKWVHLCFSVNRREGSPLPGKMFYPEWVSEKEGDLIVINNATSEQYGMYFIHQEGTSICFQNIRDIIPIWGLFGTLYTDRGSHCRYTSEVDGKVGKTQLTQFGRAMRRLEKEAKGKGPRSPPRHILLWCESRFRLRFGNSHRAVKSGQILYYKTEQLYWLATHA